jgi:hypothetical protein
MHNNEFNMKDLPRSQLCVMLPQNLGTALSRTEYLKILTAVARLRR